MDDPLLTTTHPAPDAGSAPEKDEDGIDWSLCTWKGSRREQHRSYLALPFRRKLELLEEMCDHVRWTMENRRRQGLPYVDPHTGKIVRPSGEPSVTAAATVAGDGP